MRLIRMVIFDSFLVALFYLWQAKGINGAKVFMEFWLWFITAAMFFCAFFEKNTCQLRMPVMYRIYDMAGTVAFVAALLFFGFVALPIALFIAWALLMGKVYAD